MCANLALNGLLNTRAWNCAVDETPGTLEIPPVDYEQGFNFGGIGMKPGSGSGYSVPAVTLDNCIGENEINDRGVRLIKLDVEGMELAVLKGAQRLVDEHHPIICAENNLRDRSPALLQWLLDADYMLYWHLPFTFSTTNFYGTEVNPFTDPAGNPTLLFNIPAASPGSP